MADEYTLESSYWGRADVKDIQLFITEMGERRVALRAQVVNNSRCPDAAVRMWLVHQRRARKDEWEDIRDTDLTRLKGGEGVMFPLRSQATLGLYRHLQNLYKIYEEQGILPGKNELVVGRKEEVLIPDSETAEVLMRVATENPKEILEIIAEESPDVFRELSHARLNRQRREVVKQFEAAIADRRGEREFWQSFFRDNKWIFGYGLRYVLLSEVQAHPHYGGIGLNGRGDQIGDFLLSTVSESEVKFTVLVEIKEPGTDLLVGASGARSGVWNLGRELMVGVSQLQVACRRAEVYVPHDEAVRPQLEGRGIYTVQPRGILVVGNLHTVRDDLAKRVTFESFRRSLHNPEILTFDELLARARFIVEDPPAPVGEGAPEDDEGESNDDGPFDDVPF